MNISNTLLLLFAVSFAQAQQPEHLAPPKTFWQSLGYNKQPVYAKTAYYKSDSLGYEPALTTIISFNKAGHLIQEYSRIFGKYASETAHNYVYTNGKLDSINTFTTAKNFNVRQKLHYDARGVLQKITAEGVYTNFTDTYQYNSNGMVTSIERKYTNGGSKKAIFDHQQNIVTEKQTDGKGTVTETLFVYNEDALLASFIKGGKPVIMFYDSYHRIHFKATVKEDPLNYILNLRKTVQEDVQTSRKELSALRSKETSVINFDIPAEATNMEGDWIKRLQIDRRFGVERRMVFRQLKYADGSLSGDTDFDMIFESKIKHIR